MPGIQTGIGGRPFFSQIITRIGNAIISVSSLNYQTLYSMTDRLIDWLIDWPTDWPTDWPSDWLTDRLTDWPTDWLSELRHGPQVFWSNRWSLDYSINSPHCMEPECSSCSQEPAICTCAEPNQFISFKFHFNIIFVYCNGVHEIKTALSQTVTHP
jgi:hypothetical protein